MAFFSRLPEAEVVLLVNSCARGKASQDSCLDISVLVKPETLARESSRLNGEWESFYDTDKVFKELVAAGKFAEVHLDIIDGEFVPEERGMNWSGAPDSFELEVGNALAYSVPLWKRSDYYEQLKARWLPYYDEASRKETLKMARHFCTYNLDHIPLYVARGLYFQSFDRLYNAYQELLHALFIARRTYPIAYNKWIREQIVEILELPELYEQLMHLFEIGHFESDELTHKAQDVRRLLDEYAPAED